MKSKNNIYIGIDPGWSGSIAIKVNTDIAVYSCPDDAIEMSALLKKIICPFSSSNVFAIIEKVHGRGFKDGKGEKWSAEKTFRFGENFGIWKGLMASNNIKLTAIQPQEWQQLLLGKFPKGGSKRASLERVYRRHYDLPNLLKIVGKNHNYADAINLADLCNMITREI